MISGQEDVIPIELGEMGPLTAAERDLVRKSLYPFLVVETGHIVRIVSTRGAGSLSLPRRHLPYLLSLLEDLCRSATKP